MLVLSRKQGEAIYIRGPDLAPIKVIVVGIDHNGVRLGIDAPREYLIVRDNAKAREPNHQSTEGATCLES